MKVKIKLVIEIEECNRREVANVRRNVFSIQYTCMEILEIN